MEFQLLESFVAVAKALNFTRAAESLHITQSTMSSRIHKLEGDLGIPLFIRQGREIKLSHYGEVLLPYAEQCLAIRETARKKIEMEKGVFQSYLRISTASPFGIYLTPKLLPILYSSLPNMMIQVVRETGYSGEILRMVLEDQLEIGVINYVKDLDEEDKLDESMVSVIPLFDNELVFLVRPDHPVLERGPLSVHDLADQKFALLGKRTSITHYMNQFFEEHRLSLRLDYYINSIAGLIEMIRQTDMMTVLPRLSVMSELKENHIKEVRLQKGLPRLGTYLVYKERKIEPLGQVVALIKQVVHDLIAEMDFPCLPLEESIEVNE